MGKRIQPYQRTGWLDIQPGILGFYFSYDFWRAFMRYYWNEKLIGLAFIGHVAGIITYLIAKMPPCYLLELFIGVGNGMVEAACNPLVVSLPDNKTTMLNNDVCFREGS